VKSTLEITKYAFDSFKINASQLEHARTDSQIQVDGARKIRPSDNQIL